MILTKHSIARAKERLGLNKKALKRLAEKALVDGISHSKAQGNLKKFITREFFRNKTANNIKIYGEFIFIFCGVTLITVVGLPNNLKKLAKGK